MLTRPVAHNNEAEPSCLSEDPQHTRNHVAIITGVQEIISAVVIYDIFKGLFEILYSLVCHRTP